MKYNSTFIYENFRNIVSLQQKLRRTSLKLKKKLNVKTNVAFMKLTVAADLTNTFEKPEEISRFVLMNISHTCSLTLRRKFCSRKELAKSWPYYLNTKFKNNKIIRSPPKIIKHMGIILHIKIRSTNNDQ